MGQQTEELNLNAQNAENAPTMNPYNQRPGPYNPYAGHYNYNYNNPPPYNAPPYPSGPPYGMPTPNANYGYYAPIPVQDPSTPYATNPPMYALTIPYTQTRMTTPTPYAGYPPPTSHPPSYNYNTTNLITRPTRPPTLYPQLSQIHTYPPQQHAQNSGTHTVANAQTIVKAEPSRDSVESNTSRKSSEVSIGVSHRVIFQTLNPV